MNGVLVYGTANVFQYAGIYFWILIVGIITFMGLEIKRGNERKRQIINSKSQLFYVGSEGGWNIGKIMMLLGCIPFVLLLCALLAIIHMIWPQYCILILQNIDAIESIIVSYMGVVISVIIFSVTLAPKDYYLTRTRDDVNRQFKIHIIFQILVICTVASIICYWMLKIGGLNKERNYYIFSIYELCCTGVLLGGLYGLVIIGILALGRSRVELRSLNKLYEIFWNKKPLKLLNQKSDVIYVNLEYLLKRYSQLTYVRSKKIRNIYSIEYIIDADNDLVLQKKAIICICKVMIIIFIVSALSMFVNQNYIVLIISFVIYFASFCCLYNVKLRKIIGKCCVDIVLDRNGFLIKNNDKNVYVGVVPLWYDISARRYINSICNLMAFYYIICSCWKKKRYKEIAESYEDMIEYIDNISKGKEGLERAILYLPVFLCGYYYHINFEKKVFPKEIVRLYNSFNLTDDEKKQYYTTLNSFILYASRNRATKKEYDEIKRRNFDEEYYKKYIEITGYSKLFEG